MKMCRFAISAILICAFWALATGVFRAQTAVEQQDKLLYEHASKALKNSEYASARKLMEDVINSYPDSQFVAPAKFSIANAWYEEGNLQAGGNGISGLRYFLSESPRGGGSAGEDRKYSDEKQNVGSSRYFPENSQ